MRRWMVSGDEVESFDWRVEMIASKGEDVGAGETGMYCKGFAVGGRVSRFVKSKV